MNAARWEQIQNLFDLVLGTPPESRETVLKSACEGDEDLFSEVMSLLEADSEGNSLFEGIATDHVDVSDIISREGELIGPFQLVRKLGAGGMGVVYLGQRIDGQFEQEAAIKLIKRGMRSEQLLRRFENERQIQARLDHPNIAKLLDGGLTADGQPYFTMEYVEGLPIDEYCQQNQLGVEERIQLFRSVCEAIQYAHQHLVVHRDLKPSNILVTETGRVKVLDFGIAKVIGENESIPAITQTSAHVMTPEYASPEQVKRMLIGTSTDVYSLGIILYELLAGKRPYELAGLSFGEMERVICEQMPPRPSQHAEQFARQLSGDLDTICLKSLRKEPERRYSSVEKLSEDLDRYLAGMPVLARPDTFLYRSQKFVKRNTWPVITAASLIFLTVLLVTFYTIRLATERDRAQVEAQKSEQIAAFLTDLFEVSAPEQGRGDSIPVRELLDEGALKIERNLAEQPEIQASMMDIMGVIYRKLANYEQAASLLEKSVTSQQALGQNPVGLAKSLYNLGEVRHYQNQYSVADSLYQEALVIQKKSLGPVHIDIAKTLDLMARVKRDVGAFEAADSLNQLALGMKRALFQEPHVEIAISLHSIALLHKIRQEWIPAKEVFELAYAMRSELDGPDHPKVINIRNNMASVLFNLKEYDKSEALYRENVAASGRTYGNTHTFYGYSLAELAYLLMEKGELEESEALFREALEIEKEGGDPSTSMLTLSRLMQKQEKWEEAIEWLNQAVQLDLEALGEGHPYIADDYGKVADLYAKKGEDEQAALYYEKALAVESKGVSRSHKLMIRARQKYGRFRWAQGEFAAAKKLLQEVHRLRAELVAPDHYQRLFDLGWWARAHIGLSEFEAAEKLLKEAEPLLKTDIPYDEDAQYFIWNRFVVLYQKWEKPDEATRYLELLGDKVEKE